MSVATADSGFVQTDPYSEFVRALETIEKNQLTLASDSQLPGKNEIIDNYHALVAMADSQPGKDVVNDSLAVENRHVKTMRQMLRKTIARYDDKYANYITPEALALYKARRNGSIVGAGLKFRTIKGGCPLVIGALSGGPMDGKNIEPGDKLISVDDKPLIKLSSGEVKKMLTGPVDSSAKIEVLRMKSSHTLHFKRTAVDIHYADSMMLERDIGYIKISRFGSRTHVQVGELLAQLIAQGARGYILDLRDNPGGSTRAARAIISLFSAEQDMYCEKYKSGALKQLPRYGNHKTDSPLAVLINGNSMSCSEVVAGAIKTYQRGTIVGTRSFGKGVMQRVFDLSPPLGGAIRLTIAVMGRPDRKFIHNVGVDPDVLIETDSDFMFRRVGSLNISNEARAFQRALLEIEVREKMPEKAASLIEAKDNQLQAAIDIVLGQMVSCR